MGLEEFVLKPEKSFLGGIHKLDGRWGKCVANNGLFTGTPNNLNNFIKYLKHILAVKYFNCDF